MNNANLSAPCDDATCLRPAEWVFPGHPDKLADAIAEAIVCEAFSRQREALCGIEVAVHRDAVYLTGRLACEGARDIDIEALVRGIYRSAGYGRRWRPAPEEIKVGGNLCVESLTPGEEKIRHIADDQAIVVGYAINLPGTGCLPPEQWLVRELARELYGLVQSPLELCPDGKVMLVLEESPRGRRLRSVSASLLAPDEVSGIELQRATVNAIHAVLERGKLAIPDLAVSLPDKIVVNGGGAFVTGGPEGDNGLSGKKLLMDFYGPRVPVGGGAMFGKDFWRADRQGALLARRLALECVQAGGADEATVVLGIFPGDEVFTVYRLAQAGAVQARPASVPASANLRLALAPAVGAAQAREVFINKARWGSL